MDDLPNQSPPDAHQDLGSDVERTKHVTEAAWTAGLSAFFMAGALITNPTWPVAAGVAAISAMIATLCYFILRPR